MHSAVNRITHLKKPIIDHIVRKTQYFESTRAQICVALLVIFYSVRFIVLRTVKLDNKFCPAAAEIRDILSNDKLPKKTDGVCPQVIIPKMVFLLCRVAAKLARTRRQVGVSAFFHIVS